MQKAYAAERFDKTLFKQPPPKEDCPICFIQLPYVTKTCHQVRGKNAVYIFGDTTSSTLLLNENVRMPLHISTLSYAVANFCATDACKVWQIITAPFAEHQEHGAKQKKERFVDSTNEWTQMIQRLLLALEYSITKGSSAFVEIQRKQWNYGYAQPNLDRPQPIKKLDAFLSKPRGITKEV